MCMREKERFQCLNAQAVFSRMSGGTGAVMVQSPSMGQQQGPCVPKITGHARKTKSSTQQVKNMKKADIGITPKQTGIIADMLKPLLADEFLLYLKTRNAHWNIEGPDFHTIHVYFEQLYTELETVVDDVAERIRKIGHYAPATMKEYLSLTHLTEGTGKKNDSISYMKALLSDHDAIIVYLRESIHVLGREVELAYGTSDYLTSLMEQHETTAWMLRSHLK